MREMLESVFGGTGAVIAQYIITLLVILVAAAIAVWLVRRFAMGSVAGGPRGRAPRLAVVDALIIDRRRRLLLVRRDNVEHLILIGGPSDLVIEPTVGRTQVARRPAQTRPATPAGGSPPPTTLPMPVETPAAAAAQPAASPPDRPAEPRPVDPPSVAAGPTPRARTAPSTDRSPLHPAPPRETFQSMSPFAPHRRVSQKVRPSGSDAAPAAPNARSDPREIVPKVLPVDVPAAERAPTTTDAVEGAPPFGEESAHPATEDSTDTTGKEADGTFGGDPANVGGEEGQDTTAKVSDLEEEMARLLGQISTTKSS